MGPSGPMYTKALAPVAIPTFSGHLARKAAIVSERTPKGRNGPSQSARPLHRTLFEQNRQFCSKSRHSGLRDRIPDCRNGSSQSATWRICGLSEHFHQKCSERRPQHPFSTSWVEKAAIVARKDTGWPERPFAVRCNAQPRAATFFEQNRQFCSKKLPL